MGGNPLCPLGRVFLFLKGNAQKDGPILLPLPVVSGWHSWKAAASTWLKGAQVCDEAGGEGGRVGRWKEFISLTNLLYYGWRSDPHLALDPILWTNEFLPVKGRVKSRIFVTCSYMLSKWGTSLHTAQHYRNPLACLSQFPRKWGSFTDREMNFMCSGAWGLWEEEWVPVLGWPSLFLKELRFSLGLLVISKEPHNCLICILKTSNDLQQWVINSGNMLGLLPNPSHSTFLMSPF